MSGLLFLTDEYFKILSTPEGEVLGTNIRGISLILFYSTQCPYCEPYIPIFKKLPGTVGGCQFGMINISTHRSVVEKSKNTIIPLTYVPYIVLYSNGKPVVSYDGPPNEYEIKNFIMTMVQSHQTKQQFIAEKEVEQSTQSSIPEYTIGRPKNFQKCYLEWDNAYQTK